MPAASIEEVVRLKYGGITVHKAVDTSPQRRVDTALMFLTKGAHAVPGKGSEIKLIFA